MKLWSNVGIMCKMRTWSWSFFLAYVGFILSAESCFSTWRRQIMFVIFPYSSLGYAFTSCPCPGTRALMASSGRFWSPLSIFTIIYLNPTVISRCVIFLIAFENGSRIYCRCMGTFFKNHLLQMPGRYTDFGWTLDLYTTSDSGVIIFAFFESACCPLIFLACSLLNIGISVDVALSI